MRKKKILRYLRFFWHVYMSFFFEQCRENPIASIRTFSDTWKRSPEGSRFVYFRIIFFSLIVSFTHVAINELKICFRKFTFLKQNTTFGSTCERVNGVNFRRIQLKLVFSAWEEARGTTKESLESTVVNLYLPRPSYLIQTYTCDDALFIS